MHGVIYQAEMRGGMENGELVLGSLILSWSIHIAVRMCNIEALDELERVL